MPMSGASVQLAGDNSEADANAYEDYRNRHHYVYGDRYERLDNYNVRSNNGCKHG